jgi:hypothetical protein
MDATYFYVGVITSDPDNNNGDSCAIYFETNYTNSGVSDVADKRLRTYKSGGSWVDDWTLGSILTWGSPASLPPDHEIYESGGGFGAFMEYEAQIPLATLNEFGLFDEDNERIGFAVIVENNSFQHGEWPVDAIDQPTFNSDPWGELEIPEFKEVLIPIFSMIFMAAVWRRKKKK